MAFFDFMENFFFISLGITFGLILLLVYHFKQRISCVERRGDTMFELLTNVVKELQFMKSLNSYYESIFEKSSESKTVPEVDVCLFRPPESEDKKVIDFPISADMYVSKIPVSDTESSEWSESDVEDDSDSETEMEPNDDESVEYEPDVVTEKIQIQLGEVDVESVAVDVESVAVDVETVVVDAESLAVDAESVVVDAESVVVDVESVAVDAESVVVDVETLAVDDEKPELSVSPEFAEPTREQKRDIYRKMNITQLRGIATAAGIAGDMSKLKKLEMIKLLENLDE